MEKLKAEDQQNPQSWGWWKDVLVSLVLFHRAHKWNRGRTVRIPHWDYDQPKDLPTSVLQPACFSYQAPGLLRRGHNKGTKGRLKGGQKYLHRGDSTLKSHTSELWGGWHSEKARETQAINNSVSVASTTKRKTNLAYAQRSKISPFWPQLILLLGIHVTPSAAW